MPNKRVRKKSQIKGGVLYRKPIYKNMGGPVLYRQTGGGATLPANQTSSVDFNNPGNIVNTAPTNPSLPGVEAHESLNTAITGIDVDGNPTEAGPSGPIIDPVDKTPEEIYKKAVEWAADPINTPDYYGGNPIAELDPAQLEAFRQKELAAGATNQLNQQRLNAYQDWLDPNSQASILARSQAVDDTTGAFFGAGSGASARGQQAVGAASKQAQLGLQQQALTGIEGVQDDLTAGADILSGIGKERQNYVQDVINEDIKRWNFAQLAPQQQVERILAYANQLKAMELGVAQDSPQHSNLIKTILAGAIDSAGGDSGIIDFIGGLFNQGGRVYKQGGGQVDIYGNPVGYGGTRNYRLPGERYGSSASAQSPEQACAVRGGTWDPVGNQCIMPNGDNVPAEVIQQAPIDEQLQDAYVNAANYGGHEPGSIIDNVNVAAGRNPQHGGIGQNDPAFVASGFVPIIPPEGGDYRTAGYGESGRVTGALTVNKETALKAGDWYSALEAGATAEEIEAAGGPKPSKTAEVVAQIATQAFGAVANKIFEAVTGKTIQESILEGATKEEILKELKAIVPEEQLTTSNNSGTNFSPSTDGKSAAQIEAEKEAVSNAWEDTAGVPDDDNSNDDWRDEHNRRHEENVKKAAEKAISEGEAPVGSLDGPSPHQNQGGMIQYRNTGGMMHPDARGTDTVPAMLTEGEFIMDRDSTRMLEQQAPGMLDALNKAEPMDGTLEGLLSDLDDLINGVHNNA